MKLIIGLGNPGRKYQYTRHNVGFRVLDALAEKFGVDFKLSKKLKVEIAELPPPPSLTKEGVKGKFSKLILAKPQTFMNESGSALKKIIKSYKLTAKSLLVVHDDIDLKFGKIRLSQNSGSAGHRGVESIIKAVGQNFSRLRIGIDNRKSRNEIATEIYVLQNFSIEEEKALKDTIIPEATAKILKS